MIKLYQRYAVPIFWVTTAFVYAAAILPTPQAPDLGAGDKLNHIAAFLVLSVIGRSAYRARPAWRLGVGLSLFGILIELTQAIPALHRDANIWDWVADSIAIVVALAACLAWEKRSSARGAG